MRLIGLTLSWRTLIFSLNSNWEEEFWMQKANLAFLKDGDRKTMFSHSCVKGMTQKLYIHRIKDINGNWIFDKQEIKAESISFYSNQSQGALDMSIDDLLQHIPSIILDKENEVLISCPSIKEIKEIVFYMNGQSAAGPDGFTGEFYKHCWDIIKHDPFLAISKLFAGFSMSRSWISTIYCPKTLDMQAG